jgi:hypothetical protein
MQIVLIARAEPTRQTEPALGMAMLAYNLMSLFRQAVMKSGKHHPLATLHHKVFPVGAFWESSAEKNVLRLAVARRRQWFGGLWARATTIQVCTGLAMTEMRLFLMDYLG